MSATAHHTLGPHMSIGLFEDIWERRIPSANDRRALPTIESAGRDDRQVLVPHPGDPHRRPSAVAPPVSLDPLAGKPWVEAVVAEWPCQATAQVPHVRTFIGLNMFRVQHGLLEQMPNLEQLAAHDVIPEDLAGLSRLRDASFGWASYDVPPGVDHLRLLDHPEECEPYRRATVGASGLARLHSLERLEVRGFHNREPADPIAELAGLRWLRLHGWRNLRVLGRLTRLERLELIEFGMANLRAFRGLTHLHTLALGGRMDSLAGIESMAALADVRLAGQVTRDLTLLAELPRLETLELVHMDAVSDVGPIARLPGLRRLKILLGDNTDVGVLPSVSFLAPLEQLEEVELLNIDIADQRLDPLFELPRLRRVMLTGRVGPNVEELRRQRPELELRTHLTGEPEGRVDVGPVHYDPPVAGIEKWSIFQSLVDVLGTGTNDAAERRTRGEVRRRDPDLLERLEFDSEAGAVGIYAGSEADIRTVAEAIRDLATVRREDKRSAT